MCERLSYVCWRRQKQEIERSSMENVEHDAGREAETFCDVGDENVLDTPLPRTILQCRLTDSECENAPTTRNTDTEVVQPTASRLTSNRRDNTTPAHTAQLFGKIDALRFLGKIIAAFELFRQAALVSDESSLEACACSRLCAIQIDDLYLYFYLLPLPFIIRSRMFSAKFSSVSAVQILSYIDKKIFVQLYVPAPVDICSRFPVVLVSFSKGFFVHYFSSFCICLRVYLFTVLHLRSFCVLTITYVFIQRQLVRKTLAQRH